MTDPFAEHAARCKALAANLGSGDQAVCLAKDSSNLFRDRTREARRKLDVRQFRRVLGVDAALGVVDAEAMVPYDELADACLAQGLMPAVVPELKSITLGGAVAGVGIEASSHRYGLVHESVSEIEVLCGDGRVRLCTPHNEHSDLFFGFPNSYGTLGYAVRIRARAVPVRPYVRLEHLRFSGAGALLEEMERRCTDGDADFIEAVMFAPDRGYLSLGRFCDSAPQTSDYTFEHIYYRSIEEKREDTLKVRDFLWRWDTDWFWCSKNLFAQNPFVRRLYGRSRLGSRTYTKIMRWNSRMKFTRLFDRLRGMHCESVIQDVDVPIGRGAAFFDFYAHNIGIWPLWLCPIGPQADAPRYTLYPMRNEWYVNFGFWDVIRTRQSHLPGHFNRLIEKELGKLGGIKSLYSDSYYTEDEFRSIYGGEAYQALKAKYDPQGVFPDLYAKCVQRR